MKKRIFAVIAAIIACFVLVACGKKPLTIITENGNKYLILKPESNFASETLKAYMDHLKENGELDFTEKDGMITSINGTENADGYYWMLYTDDAANSNDAWGTCEYDGKIYSSASYGAESLIIAENKTYVWLFQNLNANG